MKRIYRNAMLAIMAVAALSFTGCKDDNESNPTLTQPTQFVLNSPAITGNVDLQRTKTVSLTWSQPREYNNFDAPVVPTYWVQISPTGSFNKEFDANAEENTGADYFTINETYSSGQNVELNTETINRNLLQLLGWENDEQVPANLDINIRVKAAIRDASFEEYYPIYSNVVTLKTVPYYMELKPAAPEIWYLVGGCIGDGSWSNNEGAIGTGLIPMNIVPGYEYDKKTGTGEIQYIGYFPDNAEFKIVKTPGDWDHYVFCGDGTDMGTSLRNGGDDPGNIKIANGGYYKIVIDTKEVKITIEPYEEKVNVYDQLCLAGGFNGWSDTDMNKVFSFSGAVNHYWSYEIESSGDNTKYKVKIPGSWETNWGYKAGYAGEADGDGNIVVPEGKWLFIFCDIDGSYMLIERQ